MIFPMKKIFLPLILISLTGCSINSSFESFNPSSTSADVSLSSTDKTTNVETGYKINHSSASLTMGDELQLLITNNGVQISGITWTSSDTQLARVDETGKVRACFFTDTNEIVTITGKTTSGKLLTCNLTIKAREDAIFMKCYQHAQSVSQDSNGHVIYAFIHAGTEADGTLLVNKTFEYDSYTNICNIKVQKSYTQNSADAYYIGINTFYWGDYQNGLFYGQYSEVYNGSAKSAVFEYHNIGFSYSSHTIYLATSTTYSICESDWCTITDESTVALGVFYRIQECSEFAEEKFEQYSFGIHLF